LLLHKKEQMNSYTMVHSIWLSTFQDTSGEQSSVDRLALPGTTPCWL
jgi:hypothetical protein